MKCVLILLLACLPQLSFAATAKGFSPEELLEKIDFHYSSSDGDFQLDCKHWIGNTAGDFDVICGKGTRTVKQYLVHLVIRPIAKATETSFEVLYWVTDRSKKSPVAPFSSVSQIITVDTKSQLKKLRMSQGIENDYAMLDLTFAP
jgi:hypothetical protein